MRSGFDEQVRRAIRYLPRMKLKISYGEIFRLRRMLRSGFGQQVDRAIRYLPRMNLKIHTERYRSGHNGADSKSVCAQAHEGSNPSLSAKAAKSAS